MSTEGAGNEERGGEGGLARGAGETTGALASPMGILALLTSLNLLNYLDRYVLSAVLPKVQDDLHVSNWAGGWLATVFLIGYFATSPIFGTLADRAGPGGRRRLLMVGVSVWSLATVATGLSRDVFTLFAARAVVGVGEASYATIAPTLIDDMAGPSQKARWMAIFNAAMPVGAALGYILGGSIEQAHGWRAAFFVVGGPGIAAGLLCLLIAEPRRRSSPPQTTFASGRALLASPLYRQAVVGYCAYTAAIGGFAYWAPTYVYRQLGLAVGKASVVFGMITFATGFLGTLLGGWLADALAARARRRGEDDEARSCLWVCVLSAGLGAPLAAAAILSGTAGQFFALAAASEIALFMSSGPVNVLLLRSAPPSLRASAMAFAIFCIHLFGDMWSQPLIGKVADLAPWTWAMAFVPILFGAASFVWWRASARLTGAVAVR